ncbi:Cloroperoxidase [Periconia macrospinosa]|uniref:Cloroperoxidase n=1 Tax=Periconia macrospinosa TaxID=97972 RepID=A0A2V1D5I0_9PLEO|nr:Cloroperoxidase [Periconia macrospinosa]
MRVSLICSATLFPLACFAFPAIKREISEDTLAQYAALAAKISREVEVKRGPTRRAFDADAQRISTTGEHAYVSPGPDDIRGPCPGLNTLANHGYISRTGVDSILAVTTAANEVFGMSLGLATFLSVYSGVMTGDITSFSIGGKPKSSLLGGLTSSLGLLGEGQGLSASHNRFECDASPTRADYNTGDPVSLNLAQFEQLVAMPKGPNGYDLTVMNQFRGAGFNRSIATNGHFFAGPFTHLAVNAAAYSFTYRFFGNWSAERPGEGYLDLETLKSFEGVIGEPGNFQWKQGRERFPENWHRRPIGDEYSLFSLMLDAVDAITTVPYVIAIGGNTGKPNTFTGVNVGDLTGGVFNAQTLLQGNNLACFAFQAVNLASPDILRGGLLGDLAQTAVQKLTEALGSIFATLNCPQLVKYDTSLFNAFPGAGSGL